MRLGLAPGAVLLALAVSHFDHQGVVGQGFRDVHHVQDLASGRPGIIPRLFFALHFPAQAGQVPLPVRAAGTFLGKPLRLRPWVGSQIAVGTAANTYPFVRVVLVFRFVTIRRPASALLPFVKSRFVVHHAEACHAARAIQQAARFRSQKCGPDVLTRLDTVLVIGAAAENLQAFPFAC